MIGYTEHHGYDANASHGWIIFEKGSEADPNSDAGEYDTGVPSDEGGIIGTSEWTWANEDNLREICEFLDRKRY